jgi:hypothetical protein
MKDAMRLLRKRISSERMDLRVAQGISFSAGLALMIVAITGLARLATTQAEVLIGVLCAGGTCMTFINMGLILGLMAEVRKGTRE